MLIRKLYQAELPPDNLSEMYKPIYIFRLFFFKVHHIEAAIIWAFSFKLF